MAKPTAADRIERLRSIPLFGGLTDRALRRIVKLGTEFEAAAGHVLAEARMEGSGLFVIEEGEVVVDLPGGKKLEHGPGEFIGELSLLAEGIPRTARVRAKTPVRCLAISRFDFHTLLEEEPKIAIAMLAELARRMANAATS